MKHILLPYQHVIFEFFPELQGEDKTFADFKLEAKEKLKELYEETDKFFLLRTVDSSEHVNWRYPLMTPFFIKEETKGKKVLHVGSRGGELDEGMSHYASKITSIEMDTSWFNVSKCRKIKCPRIHINSRVQALEKIEEAEVFYTYTTFVEDISILNYLFSKVKSGTFFVGVAQQEDKLRDLLRNVKSMSKKLNAKVDYVPILFDESENYHLKYEQGPASTPPQFPVGVHTNFTRLGDSEWGPVHTFGNQWGVMLLLKLEI